MSVVSNSHSNPERWILSSSCSDEETETQRTKGSLSVGPQLVCSGAGIGVPLHLSKASCGG